MTTVLGNGCGVLPVPTDSWPRRVDHNSGGRPPSLLWCRKGRDPCGYPGGTPFPDSIPPGSRLTLGQKTPVSHDGEKAVEKLRAVIERLAPSQTDPRASGPPGAFDVYVVEYLQVVRHEADGSD